LEVEEVTEGEGGTCRFRVSSPSSLPSLDSLQHRHREEGEHQPPLEVSLNQEYSFGGAEACGGFCVAACGRLAGFADVLMTGISGADMVVVDTSSYTWLGGGGCMCASSNGVFL
jgi:hypothetical protein